jgi:hypothetical protein
MRAEAYYIMSYPAIYALPWGEISITTVSPRNKQAAVMTVQFKCNYYNQISIMKETRYGKSNYGCEGLG